MNKIFTKIIILTAMASLLFGCKKTNEDHSSSKPHAEIVTDKFIVQNSHSEYSVVIPKKYKDKERVAADTLVSYIRKSTGAKLNIIYDNEVISGSHYISLGNTSVFANEYKDVSMSELDGKISSYFISTKNENIYVYSNPNERGEGTLFGTFDLLHELVNYEYYAEDEIYYTDESNVNLRNYKDFFIHPSFDGRSIGNRHLMYSQDTCDNLRILNQYRGSEWVSDIYGHSQITSFVRPQAIDSVTHKTLHEAHPDWFSNPTATVADTKNNQLCWSAGEELEDYVAQRFIDYFKKYPNATYFMFGQEDNQGWFCKCDRCKHAIQEYAVNYAGLQIIFMNHVIEKTEAWLRENEPGRQVRYVVFAYYATKTAPVVKKDGKWTLANNQVIPHKNLQILYAPITCNFAFPLENNTFNSDTYLEISQWNEVAGGQVMIYLYDVNFRFYFANFYNFSTVKAMYQECKDLGVSYMYTQGATDTNTGCFSSMREYVESKLMWDLDYNYDDLARDFISHYYYEAADEIYEYYVTIRDRLAKFHVENNDGGGIYASIVNDTIYPYTLLRYLSGLINKGLEKIKVHEVTNPDLYSNLKARIMREYLSVIYLEMKLAKSKVSDAEKAELKEIFKTYIGYFNITGSYEGETTINVDELFA